MKKTSLFVLLMHTIFSVQAQDPFDKTQRVSSSNTTSNPEDHQATSCHSDKHALAENSSLQQIKLVGMISKNNQLNAILLNKDQQVIFSQKEDVIAQEKLKITDISQTQVKLFDCQQSQFVYITF